MKTPECNIFWFGAVTKLTKHCTVSYTDSDVV